MATHSRILAWRIPWTEESGGLPSMVLQRVRHDRATNTHTHMTIFRNQCPELLLFNGDTSNSGGSWKQIPCLLTPRSEIFPHQYMLQEKLGGVVQSRLTLCDPRGCSPPDSSVHGILQARILERIAMPSSRDLLDPGIEPTCPALAGRVFFFFFFIISITWKAWYHGYFSLKTLMNLSFILIFQILMGKVL